MPRLCDIGECLPPLHVLLLKQCVNRLLDVWNLGQEARRDQRDDLLESWINAKSYGLPSLSFFTVIQNLICLRQDSQNLLEKVDRDFNIRQTLMYRSRCTAQARGPGTRSS